MSTVPLYDSFNVNWSYREYKDGLKGGSVQAYPTYDCIFQLSRLVDTNVRMAFAVSPEYDEKKNENGKRPAYTPEMPEMQGCVGQVSYGIGDKKLQEFFTVTFPEQAIDRLVKLAQSDSKVAKRLAEIVRDKNLSEADLKKKLLEKCRPILSTKGGYDPVLHTKVDWRDPTKQYSTSWIVTRPELLAMSPPSMDTSEKLSELKLWNLYKKPWQGCKTVGVVSFNRITITKSGEIFFKFDTRTVLIIEGTSNSSGGVSLNLNLGDVSVPAAAGAVNASSSSSSSTTPAAPAATPVTDKVKAEKSEKSDKDKADKSDDDAVKPMAPPSSSQNQPAPAAAAAAPAKEKKPKSDKPKKSAVVADVDDS